MSEEQLAMWNRKGYAVHLVTQRGQPYGSVRRCCELCGVMVWPERQGDDTPMFVTSDEEYALMESQRCDRFMRDISGPEGRAATRPEPKAAETTAQAAGAAEGGTADRVSEVKPRSYCRADKPFPVSARAMRQLNAMAKDEAMLVSRAPAQVERLRRGGYCRVEADGFAYITGAGRALLATSEGR